MASRYTNKLLEGGDNRILKKMGEESAECVMDCKDNNVAEIACGAADIVFHLHGLLSGAQQGSQSFNALARDQGLLIRGFDPLENGSKVKASNPPTVFTVKQANGEALGPVFARSAMPSARC